MVVAVFGGSRGSEEEKDGEEKEEDEGGSRDSLLVARDLWRQGRQPGRRRGEGEVRVNMRRGMRRRGKRRMGRMRSVATLAHVTHVLRLVIIYTYICLYIIYKNTHTYIYVYIC